MHRKAFIHAPTHQNNSQHEKLNAFVHVLGILFGVVAVPNLIQSAQHKDLPSLIGITVYGCCFLMVFTFSTLYHWYSQNRLKALLKKLDRISIYFLIAGTYTPLVKFYMPDDTGALLLWILWVMVFFGMLFEIYFPDRFGTISLAFYLFMGLLWLIIPHEFLSAMPAHIATLVLSGVIMYVVGVVFYVWQRWPYHHALWHALVLTASICFYLAVLYTL